MFAAGEVEEASGDVAPQGSRVLRRVRAREVLERLVIDRVASIAVPFGTGSRVPCAWSRTPLTEHGVGTTSCTP